MKVNNANLAALSNITVQQEVSANNVANLLTRGYRAARALQQGDRVTVSPEMRAAIQRNEAASSAAPSPSDAATEQVRMRRNEAAYTANLNAIKTRDALYKALDDLNKG